MLMLVVSLLFLFGWNWRMLFFESGFKLLKLKSKYQKSPLNAYHSFILLLLGVMPVNYLINDLKVHNRSGNFAVETLDIII